MDAKEIIKLRIQQLEGEERGIVEFLTIRKELKAEIILSHAEKLKEINTRLQELYLIEHQIK